MSGSLFAVAAHLEPEILSVDEVLSLGDVEFQQHLGTLYDTQGYTGSFRRGAV